MAAKTITTGAVRKKVPLGRIHTRSRHAQRGERNESRVLYLLTHFDLDLFGVPQVSEQVDGTYLVLDGDHRLEALRRWLGEGFESQMVEVLVFTGLSPAQEAMKFVDLNNALSVSAMDKFLANVNGGRPDESHVSAIVRGAGLCISRDKVDGAIGAVGTLMRVYRRADGDTLARALRIIRDAYGSPGFEATVIDGVGHLCQRYSGELDETVAAKRLAHAHGGVKGLLGRAEVLHKQTGNQKAICVAAAAVDIINQGRGGKKLPSWWKA